MINLNFILREMIFPQIKIAEEGVGMARAKDRRALVSKDEALNNKRMTYKELVEQDMLKGTLLNKSKQAYFKFGRLVPPGEEIPLQAVKESLYKTSGANNNKEFINWLREYLKPSPYWILKTVDEVKVTGKKAQEPVIAGSERLDASLEVDEEASGDVVYNNQVLGTRDEVTLIGKIRTDTVTVDDVVNIKVKDNPKKVLSEIGNPQVLQDAYGVLRRGDSSKGFLEDAIRKELLSRNIIVKH